MKMKLALLGFGNVGRGLSRLLIDKKEYLERQYGVEFSVVGVYDMNLGGIIEADGLDIEALLEHVAGGGLIEDYPGGRDDLNSLGLIEMSGADVLVEMTYTDLETGQPALSHCQQALAGGIHVVTSNKGPAALARHDLWEIARDHDVQFRFEGAVMSGTPVISLITSSMAGVELLGFRGILNSTTNLILDDMEQGASFGDALQEAMRRGFAEASSRADIDGWDSAAKGVILANTLMHGDLKLTEVKREGITAITLEDVKQAKEEAKRYRLVVDCNKNEDGSIDLEIGPRKLELSDPLAAVHGPNNALCFYTDVMGEIVIQGQGAGRIETGFAILSDLLWIHRRMHGMAYSY